MNNIIMGIVELNLFIYYAGFDKKLSSGARVKRKRNKQLNKNYLEEIMNITRKKNNKKQQRNYCVHSELLKLLKTMQLYVQGMC